MIPLFGSIHIFWQLPPLVIAVSLVYSATRFESWGLILSYSLRWALYILSFLGSAYAILFVVSLEPHPIWYVPLFGGAAVVGYFLSRVDNVPTKAEPAEKAP